MKHSRRDLVKEIHDTFMTSGVLSVGCPDSTNYSILDIFNKYEACELNMFMAGHSIKEYWASIIFIYSKFSNQPVDVKESLWVIQRTRRHEMFSLSKNYLLAYIDYTEGRPDSLNICRNICAFRCVIEGSASEGPNGIRRAFTLLRELKRAQSLRQKQNLLDNDGSVRDVQAV